MLVLCGFSIILYFILFYYINLYFIFYIILYFILFYIIILFASVGIDFVYWAHENRMMNDHDLFFS